MSGQSRAALQWDRRVEFLRGAVTRGNEFADLLATVEPRWRGVLDVVNSEVELRILPAGDTVIRGFCLRIGRSKTGFPMELTRREPPNGSAVVARSRATVQTAPATLARMLGAIFEDRDVTSSQAEREHWDEIIGSFRVYAIEDAAKAQLLESVNRTLRDRCEIYDNGHDFGIVRIGDTPEDGEGIWISPIRGGWSFSHREQTPQDSDARIIAEATARADNAGQTLNGLLETMVSGMAPTELSAQDAYTQLLRTHIRPALLGDGYKGSGGGFRRTAGEYQVSIQFQKSKFSTRARVDYRLNISVAHPATVDLFNQANQEAHALGRQWEIASAGAYFDIFPALARRDMQWISLRPDVELAVHAAGLLDDIRSTLYPVIELQLSLPLRPPTPPAERPMRPSQDALNKQWMEATLRSLQAAGIEPIGQDDFS